MSSAPACDSRNHLNSLAAFVLQRHGAVRSLVVVCLSLIALPAAAQTGMCTGGMAPNQLMGTVGLALPNATKDSVQAASVPFAFNGAECQCSGNPDGDQPLLLDILLTSTFQ